MEGLKTVEQYCNYLGWSIAELARQAGITWEVAKKAMEGQSVSGRIRRQIVEAFGRELGARIQPGDLTW